MLSEHQLRIVDLYNIPIGSVKKLELKFFDKEKCVLHYKNLEIYLILGLKLKKNKIIHRALEFYQSIMVKTIY